MFKGVKLYRYVFVMTDSDVCYISLSDFAYTGLSWSNRRARLIQIVSLFWLCIMGEHRDTHGILLTLRKHAYLNIY